MKRQVSVKFPNIMAWSSCTILAIYNYSQGDNVSGNIFVAAALVISGLSGE